MSSSASSPICIALFSLLLLVALPVPSASLRLTSELVTSDSFVYLAKFAFVQWGGNMSLTTLTLLPTVSPSSSSADNQQVLFFPDSDSRWSTAVSPSTPCATKVALAQQSQDNIGVGSSINLQIYGQRPHWWYVALSNCNSTAGIATAYDITFSNGGSQWTDNISFNEQHIAETALTYFLFYIAILLPLTIAAMRKTTRAAATSTWYLLAMLLATILLAQLSNLLTFAEFMTLINTNTQYTGLSSAAYFFFHAGHCVLLLSIVLMCMGYPLITRHIRLIPHGITAAAITFTFFGLYVAAYVVDTYTQPAWSAAYVFNNGAGYALAIAYVALIAIAIVLQLYSSVESPGADSATRTRSVFFIAYTVYLSSYFLSFPFITLATSFANTWWVAKGEFAASGAVMITAITLQFVFLQPFYPLHSGQRFGKFTDESNVISKAVAPASDAVELSVSQDQAPSTFESAAECTEGQVVVETE